MNRMILAAVSVVVLLLAASAVMGWDATKDDNGSGDTQETTENDQFFQWPKVNDPDMGDIEMEHRGDTVAFSAVASMGHEFVRWVNTDGSTYSESMMMEFPIDDVGKVTAEFRVLVGNFVVEYHWQMPVFDSDGSDVVTEEVFTMAIDSADWDASIHAPLSTATPIHRLYELSDIVYAESYPATDPAHPILTNLGDYFVSEVTSASLVSWNATGPGGTFQVGDTVQLDDSSIEYAPSTALNANYLSITGASEDGVLVEAEKMGMTVTVFGKAGTFDLYIGDEVSPRLGTITVTVSEVDTSGGSNVSSIDWNGYESSEDATSTETNPVYNVTVPFNFNWNQVWVRVDDGSQAMLDKIVPAFTDSNVMQVHFIEDPTMAAAGYAIMEFYPLMNNATTTMTITNPDPSQAWGVETIKVNFTVVSNA